MRTSTVVLALLGLVSATQADNTFLGNDSTGMRNLQDETTEEVTDFFSVIESRYKGDLPEEADLDAFIDDLAYSHARDNIFHTYLESLFIAEFGDSFDGYVDGAILQAIIEQEAAKVDLGKKASSGSGSSKKSKKNKKKTAKNPTSGSSDDVDAEEESTDNASEDAGNN